MGWSQVSEAMARDPAVTPSEMRVYVAIATHRGESNRASPGMARLARYTRLSHATIKRAVSGLASKGYLRVHRTGGGRASNVYVLFGSNGLTHEPGAPMTGVTGDRGHPCTPSGVTHDPAAGSPMSPEEEPLRRTKKNNQPRLDGDREFLCDQIHEAYGEILPNLKQSRRATVIGGLRRQCMALRGIMDEHGDREHIQCWEWLFKAIAKDDHYSGSNDWHGANLWWLLQRGNLTKAVRRMEANAEHTPNGNGKNNAGQSSIYPRFDNDGNKVRR